ncbi:MAG: hypothetical protein R3E95_17945 [Thiolinea sp.]
MLQTSPWRYYLQETGQASYQLRTDADSIQLRRITGLPLDVRPVQRNLGLSMQAEEQALELAAHMALGTCPSAGLCAG